ncbi:LPXTG cell wall anchor domain-containing protein [Candidatus Enterococcus ikei]|uniref:LPXTG cell wall anchor domain-containing protein n=1 Tax=Candidatus Enterococcus ikei TaxID=2815326 RepID=A0ABS3GX86_9ENTE|nr:LPXTG cell wall anchor domain-containing protein [Enterococcus sp. DIV0869a]MBO0439875.1 LPXTG cell wall anchor domain-containing protein [Enterococcus sp. DIV0869a]
MERKKVIYLIMTVVLFSLLGVGRSMQSYADEGGAVNTDGEISFFEEEPIKDSSKPPSDSDSTSSVIEKPKGRYPSTGELVIKSLGISGMALILIVGILFLWKRKKENERKAREHE